MSINKMTFEANPVSLNISRSKFDLSYDNTFTFNAGRLIPCYNQDVLPGDTFKLDFSAVVRSVTPVAPVMDNAYLTVMFFFVPNKLVLSRQSMSPSVNDSNHSWSAIVGAQDSLLNMPLPASGVEIPTINFGVKTSNSATTDSNFQKGSLADYLGFPWNTNSTANKRDVECLEALSYYSVYNHYFRDQNNSNPVTFSITSGKVLLSGGPWNYSGLPCIGYETGSHSSFDSLMPVSRKGNYFASCLPWPQRNSTAVTLPLGDIAPLAVDSSDSTATGSALTGAKVRVNGSEAVGYYPLLSNVKTAGAVGSLVADAASSSTSGGYSVVGTNVVADLSKATAASINDIRYAFALQRWYEKLARGGNSLADMTKNMFGVTPSFAHSDRPEFLCGKTVPINQTQVNTTAEGRDESGEVDSFVGSTGAYSLTYDHSSCFTKSFDTWGTIIGVCCVRPAESFHQGLERRFSRKTKFDLYWPSFANVGEMPVLSKELYFDGTTGDDNTFGYQEAYAEYRYRENKVAGYCRPGSLQSYWTYCNNFASRPTLQSYIRGDGIEDVIDRTLTVDHTEAGFQFMANMHFSVAAVRPMPTYSVPGLIDHN